MMDEEEVAHTPCSQVDELYKDASETCTESKRWGKEPGCIRAALDVIGPRAAYKRLYNIDLSSIF